jgi:hypothetical protein
MRSLLWAPNNPLPSKTQLHTHTTTCGNDELLQFVTALCSAVHLIHCLWSFHGEMKDIHVINKQYCWYLSSHLGYWCNEFCSMALGTMRSQCHDADHTPTPRYCSVPLPKALSFQFNFGAHKLLWSPYDVLRKNYITWLVSSILVTAACSTL